MTPDEITGPPGGLDRRTVGEVMLRAPKTLVLHSTVGQARAAFADEHVHLLLVTANNTLRGTLLRSDLNDTMPATVPAMNLATLEGRTARREEVVADVYERLLAANRRLAVVDSDGTLLGLLSLKRHLTGFCTDAGVAARGLAPTSGAAAAPPEDNDPQSAVVLAGHDCGAQTPPRPPGPGPAPRFVDHSRLDRP